MRENKLIRKLTVLFAVCALVFSTCLFNACDSTHRHKTEYIGAVEATCSHNGNVEYWKCKCGKIFSDENAENELEPYSVIISQTRHNFGQYSWDDVNHYRTCTECDFKDYSTTAQHVLKYFADEEGHHRYCFCGFATEHVPHNKSEGESFCSECHYRRPLYELSETGDYYIISGSSRPFKQGVTEFVVPDTYLGLPVKAIGDRAFEDAVLEKVTLGANIVSIGSYAFKSCQNLKEIIFNDGLLEIQALAFYDCGALETVNLNSGLMHLGNGVFHSCFALKSVNIPEGITELRNHTFYDCRALESLKLHDGITKIETATFCQSGLKQLTLPPNISAIPQTAFYRCSALESVIIPATVKSIGMGAFMDCASLKTLYFEGTEQQWNQIEFLSMWNERSDFDVVCLGGEES